MHATRRALYERRAVRGEPRLEAVDRRKVNIKVRGAARAAQEIVDSANATGVDLIVIGQTGGSTTERVLREAPCSVLAVRVPGSTSA